MKITFDNSANQSIDFSFEKNTSVKSAAKAYSGNEYEVTASLESSVKYENGGKSVMDFANGMTAQDVTNEQNEMLFLSHSVSPEEYKEYLKEGDLSDVDLSDAVTIVDRIKMELIKAGKEINGYTDDLDPELQSEVSEAMRKASEVTKMTDGMKRFFVSTGKEPTIDNLYLAKFSEGRDLKVPTNSYFALGAEGYLAKKAEPVEGEILQKEVTELLEKEGFQPDEKMVENGCWLVENSFCVDEKNLEIMDDLSSIKLPLSDEALDTVKKIAVSEGKNPVNVSLLQKETVYETAIRITDEILSMQKKEVHAKRVLEETRLMMTDKANLMLIESGYSIDTKDLEEYVNALKQVEETAEYKEDLELTKTTDTVNEIKKMPAMVIGKAAFVPHITLSEVHEEGKKLLPSFDKVVEKYEEVFTTVRKDLGDSIKKAFRNIDDMLSEMDMEVTESNKRAVRILGYNSMPVTKENIESVKDFDRKLTHVLEKLSPKDTLSLIRKGKSPVDMSVEELDRELSEKENTPEEKMEKYSKFLYKLERTDSINAEERKQFIDVYRLLHQLEKTGYSAVGSLLKTGRELTFGNLKEAIKTSKHVGMDVTVDDSFGFLVRSLEDGLDPVVMKDTKLNENTTLNEAYENIQKEGERPLDEAYGKELFKQFKEGLDVSDESVFELLSQGESVTVMKLSGMEALLKKRGGAYKKVDELRGKEFRDEISDLTEEFDEEPKTHENFENMCENSKTSVFEEAMKSENYLDVRELMLCHKQLSLALSFSRNETYNVPMEVDGEMTDVILKVIHSEGEEPSVAVSLETAYLGKIRAAFYDRKGETEGYIACNYPETVTKMKKSADILGNRVSVVQTKDVDSISFSKIPVKNNSEKVSSKELYKIAKKFLKSIGDLHED